MTRRAVAAARSPTPSALDELLVTEQEIAADQRRVATECEALVDAARAEAAAAECDGDARLEQELAKLRATATTAREAQRAERERAAGRLVDHYNTLSDAKVLELAEFVATRVTGLAIGSPGGAAS